MRNAGCRPSPRSPAKRRWPSRANRRRRGGSKMGAINSGFRTTFRDNSTAGAAASGLHRVSKSDARLLGGLTETPLGNIGMGAMLSVAYATKGELVADLAHDADSVALVYDDATDANNDLYVKEGVSGDGG